MPIAAQRALVLLATTSWMLLAAPAGAQQRPVRPVGGEPPTAGVLLDAPSLVGGLDASGVELNPGALGMLDSWSLLVRHTELMEESRLTGRGTALLAGAPLPFYRALVVGAGLSWLRPPGGIGYEQSVKISLGLAYSFQQLLSVGLGYHTFIADGDPELDGLQTLDLGLAVRPYEWLGLGVVVRDLTTPVYDGLPLQRVYDLEIVGRPLATDRLELGAGLRIGERRGDLDPHFRLEGIPYDGLRLFAGVELVNRDLYRDGDSVLDVRVTAGVGINLEQVGVAFSAVLGRELDARGAGPTDPMSQGEARSAFQGVGVTLRLQGARRRPLTTIKGKLLHVQLDKGLSQRSWVKLVATLRKVERRDDVKGVLLEIDGLGNGWGHVQELRRWLARLRKAGKVSFAYVRAPSAREYYLAAAADKVLLDPAGTVRLRGLHVQRLFLRGLLDKVGLSPQFIKIAEYKSAPETFTEKTATPAAREMQRSILDDLSGQLLHDLALDRKTKAAQLKRLIDEGPLLAAREALKHKLVDRLVAPGELKRLVQRATKAELVKAQALRYAPRRWPVGPAIAVIVVEGDIVRGKSVTVPLIGRRLVGDETIAKALDWARANKTVKAVVLRVNSPGGSAMASDRMWRATTRLRKVKPLVVSMGDVAASGGYYVACGADKILAEPAAVTGSIGIFTGKFDASGLLKLLGVTADDHVRGKHADMESYTRPYTAEERKLFLARIQHAYRDFLRAVSRGRKMTQDRVHAVARGRVWTGRQARDKRLVDSHGGLMEAIETAMQRAGLALDRPVRFVVLPKEKQSLLGRALSMLRAESDEPFVPYQLRELLQGIMPVFLRARSGEPLARMPFVLGTGSAP